MTYIADAVIDHAVDVIINTRDFCGDERQAVRDLCADYDIADWKKVWRIANFRANGKWNQYQKDAGVNPKYTF